MKDLNDLEHAFLIFASSLSSFESELKEAKFEESIYKEFPDKEVYFSSRRKDRNKNILYVENSS